MRAGIIADVHSNLPAFEAVLETIDGLSVDFVVCAGDVVGYGAHPNECCEKMRERAIRSIAGNHDRAALTKEISGLNPYAATAAVWTGENLNGEARAFLGNLQDTLRIDTGSGRSLAVHHGSDRDPNEYVYEDDVDAGILERCSCEAVVLGHTHVPFSISLPSGVVANPGSVGQPRDGDPRASFAILDTVSAECEGHRIEYDIDAEAEAIRSVGLPEILARRLYIGR